MKPGFNRHLLPSVALLSLTSPVFAATWIGIDNLANNFNTGANWDTSAVPGNTTPIIIGTGATVNVNGGLNRASSTTLSGSLTISGNLNNNNGSSTSSAFTVNSGGSFTQTGGNYFIGAANSGSGTTTFTQNGGSVSVTALRGFQLSDGNGSTFTGRSAQYTINGGTFTATVANDTIAEIYNGFLAGRAGGTNPDSFTVAGGTATIQVPVTALARRFTLTNGAAVNVSSGSLSFNGFQAGRLGYDDTNIAGTAGAPANSAASKVNVSGGSLTFAMGGTSPFFSIGTTTGYNGAIEVSGGNLTFSGAQVILGDVSGGTFTQTAGTVDLTGRNLLLANTLSSIGAYTMSGGSLFAGNILAGAGSAEFNFLGGDIWLNGNQTSLIGNAWFIADPDSVMADYNSGLDTTHIYLIPEPAAAGLGGIALLTFLIRRRRPISRIQGIHQQDA